MGHVYLEISPAKREIKNKSIIIKRTSYESAVT